MRGVATSEGGAYGIAKLAGFGVCEALLTSMASDLLTLLLRELLVAPGPEVAKVGLFVNADRLRSVPEFR